MLCPASDSLPPVEALIPHRGTMRLLDRVIGFEEKSAIAEFTPCSTAWYADAAGGMPAWIGIEAMAQTVAVLVVETLGPDAAGRVVYFMSVEGAKFRRPVQPGDQLRIHVTKERNRGNVWKFSAVARVDGVSVAEATYAAMILDRATEV